MTDLRPTGPIRVMICNEHRDPQTGENHDEGHRENEARARPAHVASPLGRTARGIIDGPVEKPADARVPVEAVLLDGYGTLLDMPDPVPRLTGLLAGAGHVHPPERVAAALRAEIAFYRRNHDRGRDAGSLAELRRDCARVLAHGLGGDAPPPRRLAAILVDGLRFTLFADVLPALDALQGAGLRLAVVSNWDCSLPGVLARLGVAHRFGAISVSARVGVGKPDPAIFHDALRRLGVAPGAALHCGDLPHTDCLGARRAGIRAVLLDRRGTLPEGQCPRLCSLLELAAWTTTGQGNPVDERK